MANRQSSNSEAQDAALHERISDIAGRLEALCLASRRAAPEKPVIDPEEIEASGREIVEVAARVKDIEEHIAKRDLELQITRSTMAQLSVLAKNGLQPQTPVELQRGAREVADVVRRHTEMLETLERV